MRNQKCHFHFLQQLQLTKTVGDCSNTVRETYLGPKCEKLKKVAMYEHTQRRTQRTESDGALGLAAGSDATFDDVVDLKHIGM